jgi:hypothetical protein
MPPEDGFGLNQEEVLAPAFWPEDANPDPQNAIPVLESRSGVGAKGDVKLMTKNEILESDVMTGPYAGDEGAEKQKQDFEHPSGYR